VLGQYVDLGNPMAAHPLNDDRVLWFYGLPNPYTGGMYWQDLTGRGNHGLLVNGPTWRQTPVGTGLLFDGTNDQCDITNNANVSLSGANFTISGWFNPQFAVTGSTDRAFVHHWNAASTGTGFSLQLFTGKLTAVIGAAPAAIKVATGTTLFVQNTWYHCAATYDGTNLKVFVNGVQEASVAGMNAGDSGTVVRIAGRTDSSQWTACIAADVSLRARATSPSEIALDYLLSGLNYPPGGPLRYWSRKTWVLGGSAPTTNYTLTAAVGSFALSGQAASLRAARVVTASVGTFALAGQPATLRAARKVTAAAGRFSLNTSGEAVYTTPGTYLWTVPAGVTAITVEGIGPGGRGASVNDRVANGFGSAGGGAYARSTAVAVTPGETLEVSLVDPATAGIDEVSYVFLSRPTPLTFLLYAAGGGGPESGGGVGYGGATTDCTYNDIAYAGGNGVIGSASGSGGGGGAGLTGAGANASGATPGAGGSGNPGTGTGGGSPGWDGQSYGGGGGSPQTGYADPSYRPIGGGGWLRITWTGTATAGLRADRRVTAAVGSFTLAGQAAGLRAARTVTASVGTFAITGQDAALRAARTLTAAVGAFTLSGNAAGLSVGRTLVGGCGVFGVSGQDAGLRVARTLPAGAGAFVVTGYAAGLTVGTSTISALRRFHCNGRGEPSFLADGYRTGFRAPGRATPNRFQCNEAAR